VVNIGQHELIYIDERSHQRPMAEHTSTAVLHDSAKVGDDADTASNRRAKS
jgi:hypothetical protein